MLDKYVIFFIGSRSGWAAVSITTGKSGSGYNPREALDNAIETSDQLIESVQANEYIDPVKPTPRLISKLARIAQPLDDVDFAQGVVYTHERTIDDIELS